MGKNPWLILLVAVLLGGVATFFAARYIHTRIDTAEAAINKAQGKKVQVIVAKADQAHGTRIRKDALAVREIAEAFVNADMISPDKYEEVVNQRLTLPVRAGQPLQWSFLESGQSPAFSGRIPAGWRALTFQVDDINSISGMVVPGDRIDLVATLKRNDTSVTLPLLQNVIVLATGQTVTRSDATTDHVSAKQTFNTLTLQLSPQDANKLIVAQDGGKLTALLRHPDDVHHIDIAALDVSQIVGSAAHLVSRAMPVATSRPMPFSEQTNEPSIEIIYGGKGEKNTVRNVVIDREMDVSQQRRSTTVANRELAAEIVQEIASQMDDVPSPQTVVGSPALRGENR